MSVIRRMVARGDLVTENKVYGYCRVSTDEQASSGLGLAAQRAAIASEARRRGWQVEFRSDDGFSAKTLNRPQITELLGSIRSGDILVVAKLDRLSRSLIDFAGLMERARREGWSVVALDLGVDTTTPAGEMMANVMASFAQYERRLIGERTRAALHQKKAEGAQLGRPRVVPENVRLSIRGYRDAGLSFRQIAGRLDRDGVATARGGSQWRASSVKAIIDAEASSAVVQPA